MAHVRRRLSADVTCDDDLRQRVVDVTRHSTAETSRSCDDDVIVVPRCGRLKSSAKRVRWTGDSRFTASRRISALIESVPIGFRRSAVWIATSGAGTSSTAVVVVYGRPYTDQIRQWANDVDNDDDISTTKRHRAAVEFSLRDPRPPVISRRSTVNWIV